MEYCSPCPFCKDGDDRFLIWPNRQNNNGELQGGRFSCRRCGKYGDAITFLRELHGVSYKEACEILKIEPKKLDVTPRFKREIKLPIANDPSELWQSKGNVFVEWCHSQLMKNHAALGLVQKRGFNIESTARFKLGFNPKDFYRDREEWGLDSEIKDDGKPKKLWLPSGLVIPTFSPSNQLLKIKIRRTAYEREIELYNKEIADGKKLKYKPQKYAVVSGSKEAFSIYGDCTLKVVLILESELDALLLQQEAGDLVYCIALGGSTKPLDFHTDQLIRKTQLLIFCPDFDKAGAMAWVKWKKIFPSIQRILTPDGKGAGDAFLAGVNLRDWLVDSLKNIQRNESKNYGSS